MFLKLLRKLFLFLITGMKFGKHERKCALILFDIKRRLKHDGRRNGKV
jgi:hypothetical protein